MADQDDELLQDYDDPSGGDDDQDAKIKAFQKKVKGLEKIILSPKQQPVEKRREAVRMLGELGEVEVIPSLVRVYQKDKSPGMKEEAARALGMFKALEDALYDSDPERQEYAQTLIESIVLHDAIGQRSRVKRRPLQILSGVLVITLIGLLALGMTAASQKTGGETPTEAVASGSTDIPGITDTPIPTPSDVPGIAALLQIDYAALSSDTSALRKEMLNSTRQQPIDCTVTLKKPIAIVLPATMTDAQIVSVTETLNKARTDMAPIVQAYETACSTKQPIAPADANSFDGILVTIQTNLVQVPSKLSTFGVTPVVPVVTAAPVTPTATETPTPTATPLDPKKFSRHIAGLRDIVTKMTASAGYNTLLRQYWDDIVQSGSTGGCRNLPAPTIPEEYVLPEDIAASAPAELITAVDNINTGLNLSRGSWNAFVRYCSDTTLASIASQQYTAADTAQTAFKEADTLIDTAEAKIKGLQK